MTPKIDAHLRVTRLREEIALRAINTNNIRISYLSSNPVESPDIYSAAGTRKQAFIFVNATK
jgi:hypothetical protein